VGLATTVGDMGVRVRVAATARAVMAVMMRSTIDLGVGGGATGIITGAIIMGIIIMDIIIISTITTTVMAAGM
jgi:hypothetical protein